MNRQKTFHLIKVALLTVIFAVCMFAGKADAAELVVKMLDVGQGDAFLIKTESENILIDTSDTAARSRLIEYLINDEVYTINRLILTHPHADHIANAAYLINNGFVNEVYDNGRIVANQYYRKYLKACKEYNIPRYTLREGDTFFLDDGAYLQILSANRNDRYENNSSVVAKLVYGNFSMLFTGDAELSLEDELFQNSNDLSATILKAAHHGSKTSNSLDFVTAANPQYVFISAALNNKYGHPHAASLDNFLIAGVPKNNIYWTGKNGTVTVTTDGTNITVTPEIADNWVNDYLQYKLTIEDIYIAE